jgi:glutamate dehydrogenase (NAD(P)+)
MGGSTARYLVERGARVVALSEASGTVTNPAGLDVERLLATRSALGDIDRSALRPDDRELPRDEWLSVDTDLLVPAAVADSISAENSWRVKASLVVEAANIPTTEEAQRLLHQRGVLVIPDYVANGGTNAWFWWVLLGMIEPTAEAAFRVIGENMRRSVAEMLELADRDGLLPRQAADATAMRNLDRLAEEYGAEVPATAPGPAGG